MTEESKAIIKDCFIEIADLESKLYEARRKLDLTVMKLRDKEAIYKVGDYVLYNNSKCKVHQIVVNSETFELSYGLIDVYDWYYSSVAESKLIGIHKIEQ